MDLVASGILHYDFSLLGRLVLAAVLGGMLGFEREIHGRPAGFRTHLLVALGACLMMLVSEFFLSKYNHLTSTSAIRIDPGRVAAQIVTGIGFLGAGAIIKDGSAVRGLTTAACLWVAAGIGMAAGTGLYLLAVMVTGMSVGTLMFLKRVEKRMDKVRYGNLTVYCDINPVIRQMLEDFLVSGGWRLVETAVEKDKVAGEVRYDFVVSRYGGMESISLVDDLAAYEGVRKVRFR
jgi:putative Mg2+ transporter-C (MgtC) family protein